jgi:uncharacterized protein (TIGR03067 family)
MRAHADLASSRTRIYALAEALQAFLRDKGHFPRGTMPRPVSPERGLDWYPNQRLSWMVELLPYLAEEYRTWPRDLNQSWDEGENLKVAARMVPFYIEVRQKNPAPVYTRYPGKPDTFGATHYVGVAGVGMKAPRHKSDNPKRGVFGYDRTTSKDEIKDGLDNTIVLLQVPDDHKAPWMAGGGSTVRGVSEDVDAVAPFVCFTHKGKPGTRAIMADGKVRFIPANIDPNTFRAMCTVAGGEKINKLDEIAPVIPEEDGLEAPPPPPPGGGEPGGPPERPATGPEADLPKLQGNWQATTIEIEGKAVSLGAGGPRLTIKDKFAWFTASGKTDKDEIRIDSTKSPKTIDLVSLDGPNRGKTQKGIYELSGDSFKVCMPEGEKEPRPTSFVTKVGLKAATFTFKRTTAEPVAFKVEWKDFTSKEWRYTVRFPSARVVETSRVIQVKILKGKKTSNTTLYTAMTRSGGTTCSVSSHFNLVGIEEAFAEVKQRLTPLASAAGGKLKENKVKNVGIAKEWEFEGRGVFMRVRLYYTGSGLHEVTITGPRGEMSAADQDTFFNSFSPK